MYLYLVEIKTIIIIVVVFIIIIIIIILFTFSNKFQKNSKQVTQINVSGTYLARILSVCTGHSST